MTVDESQHPNGGPKDPNRLTALHLLSLLAFFSGFLLGAISGYDFFCWGGGVGALVLTVGGAVLFVAGLVGKIRVDRAWAVEGDRERGVLEQGEEAPLSKVSKMSLFVIGMAALLDTRAENATGGLKVPGKARLAGAGFLAAAFLVFWLGLRMALGEAAKHMYQLTALAGLATLVLFFGAIGVLLPRRVWEEDLTFRRLLWGLGIRSLLALRLAGLFFLSTLAGITWFLVVPSLLGRLR